jgi:cyclic di-GMP phosphodiesterase
VNDKTRPVILTVDDATDLLALMGKVLGTDYEVITAENASDAIEKAFGEPRPDLILLDVELPDISGFEVCRALKGEALTKEIPIIFLTSKSDAKAQIEGLEIGAVDYIAKPIQGEVLRKRVRLHLALKDQRRELERLVKERTEALEKVNAERLAHVEKGSAELIRRLARAMEFHESAAASNRVMRLSHYAKLIAQAAGAKPEIAEMMMKAAPLHDIGKLGVPAEILRKTAKLSVPEWERVKRHPEIGAEIIGEHEDPLLKLARSLALTHHEYWDGGGYPKGLKGEAIPWAGRVMAIVDHFESMTTTQFYRDALSIEQAAAEIEKAAGSKFDAKLVEAFRKALPLMKKVRETYSDALGDLINLDFSPTRDGAAAPAPPPAPKPKPVADAATLAKRAAAKAHR